jgi:hypothetical protein
VTLSEKSRSSNLDLAFRLTMQQLAEGALAQTFFDPDCAGLKAILPTTWKEMCDQGWFEPLELYRRRHYRMTANGWIEALWRTNAAEQPALRERLGHLGAVLKGHVKGRHADVIVELTTLVRESDLPAGWVFNAIESNLIEELHGTHGARWFDKGLLVSIPLNFGIAVVDHAADVRKALEEVQHELAQTKEELGEYRCSICQAPIVAQHDVPLSEDVDGFLVAYACGRVDTDGYGSQPCPSDATYPKLEDYDLHLHEDPKEPSLKWTCLALAKTPTAGRVDILPGRGRTPEEARDQVIETYRRISKPWRQ